MKTKKKIFLRRLLLFSDLILEKKVFFPESFFLARYGLVLSISAEITDPPPLSQAAAWFEHFLLPKQLFFGKLLTCNVPVRYRFQFTVPFEISQESVNQYSLF